MDGPVTEDHPGWTGVVEFDRSEMDTAENPSEFVQSKVREAARAAMQAWADDPEYRWWLPANTFSASRSDDDLKDPEITVTVHVEARYVQWLAPVGLG